MSWSKDEQANSVIDETKIKSPRLYTCPREDDPETFTQCCWNGGCCEKPLPTINEVS